MSTSPPTLGMLDELPSIAYATDLDGRIVLANRCLLALVGLPLASVLGRGLEEVLPLELVAQAVEHEQQVVRVGLPVSRQIRVDRPEGERTWIVTKFPLHAVDEPTGVGTIVTDVTEQVGESAAARREASFLREVLDLVPNLVYTKDRNRRFTLANRAMAELVGSTPEEVLGRTELELGRTSDAVASTDREDGMVLDDGNERLTPEESRHDALGGQRWFRTTRQPLQAKHALAEQLLVVATDITEYRNAQRAQLRLRDERMDSIARLAGGIAHDLNNLLTVLQSGAEILRESMGPEAELAFVVKDIARASVRAASLTRHLLAYSRQQVLRLQRIDLNEVVTHDEDELRRLLGPERALQLSLEPGLPAVLVDRNSIGQVLLNLAANARDAMPDGGLLRIETRRTTARLPGFEASEVVELVVEDDGHGIPPGVLEQVFDPFFTTKPQGKGTGLGLSMVHGIVRQSGGDVVVSSPPGHGARFSILLPVAPTEG